MKLTKEQLFGVIRHSMTFIGGIFIAKGFIDETILTELIGGVLTTSGAIWSIISKNKS
jgi:hypothetical protein